MLNLTKSLDLKNEILWPKLNFTLKSLGLAQSLNLRSQSVLMEAIH